jgi:hypothetical protein
MKNVKRIVVVLIFMAAAVSSASGQVRVYAQVDTGRDIYVGENFGYHIILDGSETPGQVDLRPLSRFNPRSGGNSRQNSINMINNKTVQKTTTIMTYYLSVDEVGITEIPVVTVTVDGKDYRTNPVSINVMKPGTTDLLDLEMSLSETQCYVGQPVVLTVSFYVSANIGDFHLNVPTFTSGEFILDDYDINDPQAKEYQLDSGISVFVKQYRVTHNSRESTQVTFSKVLIPKEAGMVRLEPATLSADVAVGRARTRDGFFDDFFGSNIQYKRFMVSSQGTELNVLNLPEQDKPDGFYGLIGRYTISASATPTNVNVGDPITLTIKIGGSQYLKPVQWPALENIPELAENFKIPLQKASPVIEDDLKVFTQTIRAGNDKVTQIPVIELPYFNVDAGRYEVARTEPIELEVAPTKILTSADLEGTDFARVNKEVEAVKKGISANYESLDVLKNMSFSPLAALTSPAYAVIWAAPLSLLILSVFVKFFSQTSPQQKALKLKRQACGNAVRNLKKIDINNTQNTSELLVSIMKQYIGDRFDRTAGSLTPVDCYEVVLSSTEDVQRSEEYKQMLAELEAARYASMAADITDKKIEDIIELIRDVEKKSKNV